MPLIQQGALQQLMSAYTRGASASQVCGGGVGGSRRGRAESHVGFSIYNTPVPLHLSIPHTCSPWRNIPYLPPPYT